MYNQLAPREAIRDLESLRDSGPILAFDLETTGLCPRQDRIRLVSYLPFHGRRTPDPAEPAGVVDLWTDPEATPALLEALAGFRLCAHNAQFDVGFLMGRGVWPRERVYCTSVLAKLVLAGDHRTYGLFRRTGLADAAKHFLGVTLDKTQQTSRWSTPNLTPAQWEYAAADVLVLPRLLHALTARVEDARAERAAALECDCVPALAWMQVAGLPFDPGRWQIPYKVACTRMEELFRQIRTRWLTDEVLVRRGKAGTDTRPDPRAGGQLRIGGAYDDAGQRLLGSPAQLLAWLQDLTGLPLVDTADDTLANLPHGVGAVLRDYRMYDQIRKSFGATWGRTRKPSEDGDRPEPYRLGRLFPSFWQYGAETGRMSCSYPNLQQVPNAKKHPLGRQFREAFRAPPGRELVVADFSQIELRIAADISGDERMIQVYQDGGDIHAETARAILGVEEPTKAQRDIAKPVNFGLLYGAGAETLRRYARSQYGIDLGDHAAAFREAWLANYPGIHKWHRDTSYRLDRVRSAGITTRTLIGRPRKCVTSYTAALNTPVQGTGADIVKLALAHLFRDRDHAPVPAALHHADNGWMLVGVVHDEIILEVPEGSGPAMADWLRGKMVAAGNAILRHVPCDAEARHGRAWA